MKTNVSTINGKPYETPKGPPYATPEHLNADLDATGERVLQLEARLEFARDGLVDDALPLCGQLLGELARLLDDGERPSDKTLHLLGLVGRIEGCVQDAARALNPNDER